MIVRVTDKKEYVNRLKHMLERGETCHRCPRGKRFRADNCNYISHSYDMCNWCRDFVDLNGQNRLDHKCPCHIVGEKAIVRAHQCIKQWDRGKHKWQKDD